MTLAPGATLGPYEILSQIGAGGMGQVFRARDTRLGRTVAIKVLAPNRSGVADFAERFEREARAISSLNHPNVCALFDVGNVEVDGASVEYLVMEHLEGETLRTRLRTPMSVRQAIDAAVQVARGLAAAHRGGLVHRDLKPENIFLTRDGVAKILDFGVVKAIAPEGDGSTAGHTEPGLVVGTPHYVSPEQVRGDALDARSDIFSFGVVLYEMLAGEQPFDGGSPVETMAEILHNDARPLDEIVPDLPPGLSEIIERCLAKQKDERFASARDLAFSLEAISRGARSSLPGIRRTNTPARTTAATRVRSPRTRAIIAICLAAALALTLIIGRLLTRDDDDPGPPAMRSITHSGKDSSPAASPDGRLVAFVSSRDGSRRIWIEQLADGTEVALTAGPDDVSPRFSPDGSAILFTRTVGGTSALYRVAVVGGEPRKTIDNAFDGDFAPDGRRIVFVRDRVAGPQRFSTICIGTPGSADVQEVVSSATEDLFSPRWSPDGRWIAITRRPRSTTGGSLLLVRVEDGAQRVVSRREGHGLVTSAAWTRDSRAIVFGEIEAVSVVLLRSRGGAARVFRYDLTGGRLKPILWNAHAAADTIDVFPDGRLLFSEDLTRQNLREIALHGPPEPRWLTRGMAVDREPSYAPDGKRVVFCSDRSGNVDVWEIEIASGGVQRLTDDAGVDWDPIATADGKLLWSSNRGGHFEVWAGEADGGSARQVSRDGNDAENPSTPRDGSWIYYDASGKNEGLWRVRPDGSDANRVAPGETAHPEVSADGQFVLYHRPNESVGVSTSLVEVIRVADGAKFLLAQLQRGGRPRWLGATHTVVFIAEDDQHRSGVFAQEFVPGVDTTATRRPLAGFDRETTLETFAISPDGKRAVLSVLEPSSGLMIAEVR